jgi:hypothetical protein
MNTEAGAARPETGVIVRGYATHGIYWRQPLSLPGAIYDPGESLVITACRLVGADAPDAHFSEFDDPPAEEFRLLAALVLAVGYDEGLMIPQPLSRAMRAPGDWDLSEPGVLNELRGRLVENWADTPSDPLEGPYPPVAAGTYDFRDDVAPIAMQRRIHAAIDPSDRLMNRGLRTLLRFSMLCRHPVFSEEATYPLHIALEASFALFRRQFSREGQPNASSRDVAARFEQIFKEDPSGRNYFEDFYEDRIMAQHPESRFGATHYVPGTHGERLWLFKALREVYRYLLLGEVANPQET